MWKRVLHWILFVAVALQLFSCVFLGVSQMPATPF